MTKPQRTWLSAKIHGIRVTAASVEYHGSVSICPELMKLAGIATTEQVHVVNLTTGARWVTYAIPGEPGAFTLNGGGARLGVVGDECVIMSYVIHEKPQGAPAVFVNADNTPETQIAQRYTR